MTGRRTDKGMYHHCSTDGAQRAHAKHITLHWDWTRNERVCFPLVRRKARHIFLAWFFLSVAFAVWFSVCGFFFFLSPKWWHDIRRLYCASAVWCMAWSMGTRWPFNVYAASVENFVSYNTRRVFWPGTVICQCVCDFFHFTNEQIDLMYVHISTPLERHMVSVWSVRFHTTWCHCQWCLF